MTDVSEIQQLIAVVNEVTKDLGADCTNFGNALLETLKESEDSKFICNLRLLWRTTLFRLTDDPSEPLEPKGLFDALDHAKVRILAEHRKSMDSVDLQARILDLTQVMESPGPTKTQLVSQAWDAYLEAAALLYPSETNDCWVPYFDRIQRAVQLSLTRNHNVTDTLDKLCDAIERSKSDDSFLLLKLAELALNFRDVDKARLFPYLEATAERARRQENWRMNIDYLNAAIKCVPANERRPLFVKIAEAYEAEADSRESSLVAYHFVEDAIRAYRKAGGASGEVDRLHRKLLALGKKGLEEMQTFEEKVDITEIVHYVERELCSLDFKSAMHP